MIYILLRRLEQRRPVAVQCSNIEFVVFCSKGAFQFPIRTKWKQVVAKIGDPTSTEGCWCLSDSSDTVIVPCDAFRTPGLRLAQFTSPSPMRWKSWAKYCNALPLIVSPPQRVEIAAIAYVASFFTHANR